jgi:hypothetical protein
LRTDQDGYAQILMGEWDLQGISLNGVRVMNRRLCTSLSRGLLIAIVVKDTNAIVRDNKL